MRIFKVKKCIETDWGLYSAWTQEEAVIFCQNLNRDPNGKYDAEPYVIKGEEKKKPPPPPKLPIKKGNASPK